MMQQQPRTLHPVQKNAKVVCGDILNLDVGNNMQVVVGPGCIWGEAPGDFAFTYPDHSTNLLRFHAAQCVTTQIAHVLTNGQMLTFTLFVVFYVPCVATVAVMAKELGWRDTAVISAFSVVLAVVIGVIGRFGYAIFG